MGDRAILDGILSVLNKVTEELEIKIGSLYPFYTERTLLEEKDVYCKSAPKAKISIFDNKDKITRRNEIESSNLVIMGGGPLMDLSELYIIEDCFKYARRKKIPAFVMGCGIGPLTNGEYVQTVERIFDLSTAISLRDELSLKLAQKLYGDRFDMQCLGDPAVISIENFKYSHHYKRKKDGNPKYASVNLREYPQKEYGGKNGISYPILIRFIEELEHNYESVCLVPMHTFFVGGDDRAILSQIAFDCNSNNINVIQKPMNLYELYENYSNATACVGMRYHSVVMQTILNGNNVILNYTDPQNGKTQGFINKICGNHFYRNRMINMQTEVTEQKLKELVKELNKNIPFNYNSANMLESYVNWICNSIDTCQI